MRRSAKTGISGNMFNVEQVPFDQERVAAWRRLRRLGIRMPRATYIEGARGYHLRIGRLDLTQSTLLLTAAVVIGLGGGYGAVAFRWLIGAEGQIAFGWLGPHAETLFGPVGVIVPLVVGGALVALIVNRFAPEAKGHGVPEVMAAVALHGGIMRPRVIAIKSIASATCIGFGGSCGREGPIVQIGATIGSVLGQFVRLPAPMMRTLVACGAAAGISATFNAPIGGVFFASEVILGDFAPRSFASIVVASVVAAVIGRAYLGNHPSFDARAFALVSPRELLLYALLGAIVALWAAGFVKLIYAVEDRFEALRIRPIFKAMLGFGLVGILGIRYPQVFGVGYASVQSVLSGHVPASKGLLLAVLKPVATALTLGSGGSGGVFSPSLYTGAMLGDAYGRIVHTAFPTWTGPPAAYGLVAMAGLFAAAAEAPITSITIVFEMSGDYTIILPLMVCSVIATTLGRRLIGSTVYELKLERRGIDWARVRRPKLLSRVKVAVVQRTPPVIAKVDDTPRDVAGRLETHDELVIPVVGRDGAFAGVVTAAELAVHLSRDDRATIGDIAHVPGTILSSDDTLEQAAELMSNPAVSLLPIVDPQTKALLGVVTRRDVLDAYHSAVDSMHA